MNRVRVIIGDKVYNCQVAKTEEDKNKGLLGYDYLPIDEGMLFEWNVLDNRPMHMKGMKFPIDLIGINEDEEVVFVYHAQPTLELEDVIFPNSKYILEVNVNSGIIEGDDFEIDEEDLNKYVMKVLAPDGSTLMMLLGGERIFSRSSTALLIKWAKKAYSSKNNLELYLKYCKRLGKRMFKELKALNTRPPEYVEVPDSKS